MRDCEVRLTRLKPEHRELFDRAQDQGSETPSSPMLQSADAWI